MKTFFGTTAIILAGAFFLSAPVSSAELKIGYVNLQKALNDSEAGRKAKDYLQIEAKAKEDDLVKKEEELKSIKEQLDKKGSVWNKETKDAKEKELQEKSEEFLKQRMKYAEELNKKKKQSEEKIIEDLRLIVEELAKKKGYTYIFEQALGGVLYAPKDADLTNALMEFYDKRFLEQEGNIKDKDKEKGK
ncbi:MAG: OmpH family outer membrane protein [Deltaproteobacteria bacterium]|nr:OmpH family outer membrane protein [Deltaproteobacteria bacterium]